MAMKLVSFGAQIDDEIFIFIQAFAHPHCQKGNKMMKSLK